MWFVSQSRSIRFGKSYTLSSTIDLHGQNIHHGENRLIECINSIWSRQTGNR